MVTHAVEKLKIRYEKAYHTHLMTAVNRTVEEVENLIGSLDDTIKNGKLIRRLCIRPKLNRSAGL